MIKHTKRVFVTILAFFFLLLGLAGLVLPFIQGLLFIAVALILFSMLSPTVREKVEAQTRKYPSFHAIVVKIEGWIQRIIGEI